MKYQVICQGRLLSGAKEKECIGRIKKITKLSEDAVRNTLLNGRMRKVFASDDKKRAKKYGQAFRNAGLDILIQDDAGRMLMRGSYF
ncbi:Ribosomal protein L7/L12 C-terminal domain-containing protein [Candidatus Electrothrix aarhusensis]